MKLYVGHKDGCNSRGLASREVKSPEVTNDMFTSNQQFREACKNVGIEPTKRQASKFRRQMGKAWPVRVTHDGASHMEIV